MVTFVRLIIGCGLATGAAWLFANAHPFFAIPVAIVALFHLVTTWLVASGAAYFK